MAEAVDVRVVAVVEGEAVEVGAIIILPIHQTNNPTVNLKGDQRRNFMEIVAMMQQRRMRVQGAVVGEVGEGEAVIIITRNLNSLTASTTPT